MHNSRSDAHGLALCEKMIIHPAQELLHSAHHCPLCGRSFLHNVLDQHDLNVQIPDSHELELSNDPDSPYPSPKFFRSLHQLQEGQVNSSIPLATSSVEMDEASRKMRDGYYAQNFQEIQKLGQGSFGGVYACRHMVGGTPLGIFAVKKVPVGADSHTLRRVLKEVSFFERVHRHPNVLEYYHCWTDFAQTVDFGPVVQCVFILMEYASEGSLHDYLQKNGTRVSNSAIWYFFISVLEGISHLHSSGVLHRDLKPQNLLLTANVGGRGPPRVVVGDFGTAGELSELTNNGGESERTGATGTTEYMAPELLAIDPTTGVYLHQASTASDMWSLGMVLHYLMCEGQLPSVSSTGEVQLDWTHLSQRPREMVEIVAALLNERMELRPTCDELLKMDVFHSLREFFTRVQHQSFNFYKRGSKRSKRVSQTIQGTAPLSLEWYNTIGEDGDSEIKPVVHEESTPLTETRREFVRAQKLKLVPEVSDLSSNKFIILRWLYEASKFLHVKEIRHILQSITLPIPLVGVVAYVSYQIGRRKK